ncbi:MAG: T9SS type A sorting domain-containing protein, partial [Flavobacteriales bacterium]
LADNTTTTISVAGAVGFYPSPEYTYTTTTLDDVYTNADFALCPDPTAHNFSVFAYSNFSPRPGFGLNYYIVVENLGPNIDDAELHFDFSAMPGATIANSYGGVISGTNVTWNVSDLSMFETSVIYLAFDVDASVALGTIYQPSVSVNIIPGTVSDIDLYDNLYTLTQEVVGSYDPNDKTVNIPAVDIETLSSQDVVTLDYTIRFQNTGTAEAIFVRVEDVIEEDLDLTTFQMLNASHPFQLTFDEDRKVEWLFENIMLPDSTTDEEGSHGYIHFRINTKNNLQLTDAISNNCAIYFDYNEPVITNTATTEFYICDEELTLSGEGSYCEGDIISIAGVGEWDNVVWTLNSVEVGNTVQFTSADAEPGNYTYHMTAMKGYCVYEDDYDVVVSVMPATPVITQEENTLTANGTGMFIWSLDDVLIDDFDNTIGMTESGIYSVYIQNMECYSELASEYFEYTGVDEMKSDNYFVLRPNPSDEFTEVLLNQPLSDNILLRISDAVGKKIEDQQLQSPTYRITTKTFAPGVYFVTLLTNSDVQIQTLKLIVR